MATEGVYMDQQHFPTEPDIAVTEPVVRAKKSALLGSVEMS